MIAGTANPPGASEFTSCLCGFRVVQSVVFCVVFCSSLFLAFLSIVLPVLLRFTLDVTPLVYSNVFPYILDLLHVTYKNISSNKNAAMNVQINTAGQIFANNIYLLVTSFLHIHKWLGSWCLTSLSTIFEIYRGGQFY
jgi:hypothetical protein